MLMMMIGGGGAININWQKRSLGWVNVCSGASWVVCGKKKESEINGLDYPITRWNNDDFNSHCCSI